MHEVWKIIPTSRIAYVFSHNTGLSVFGGTAILRYRIYSAGGFCPTDIANIAVSNILSL